MKLKLMFAVALCSLTVSSVADAATLKPNRNFSLDGLVTTGFGADQGGTGAAKPRIDTVNASAMQPDGKLIVAGGSQCSEGGCSAFAMARYRKNGGLDPTFGDAGKVKLPFGETGSIEGMVLQDDGRIVVVGTASEFLASPPRAIVGRYLADGTPDLTFDENGFRAIRLADSDAWRLGLLDVQALDGGDVVTSGWLNCLNQCHNFLIARFDREGAVSPDFLDGKLLRFRFSGNADVGLEGERLGTSIDVDSQGRLIIAGPAGPDRIGILRLMPDGDADFSFSRDGSTTISVTRRNSNGTYGRTKVRRDAHQISVAPDDSFYIAAGQERDGGNVGSLIHVRENGTFDPRFGKAGGFVDSPGLAMKDLAIDRCGRIAVAGTLSSKKGSDFGVARYLASGRLDRSFGGVTKVTVGRGHASHASTIELFGKQLFLTGSAAVRGQADDFAVAALRMPRTAFRCPR